jgi:hypothetical protein
MEDLFSIMMTLLKALNYFIWKKMSFENKNLHKNVIMKPIILDNRC